MLNFASSSSSSKPYVSDLGEEVQRWKVKAGLIVAQAINVSFICVCVYEREREREYDCIWGSISLCVFFDKLGRRWLRKFIHFLIKIN